jgi:hypothetical protein
MTLLRTSDNECGSYNHSESFIVAVFTKASVALHNIFLGFNENLCNVDSFSCC